MQDVECVRAGSGVRGPAGDDLYLTAHGGRACDRPYLFLCAICWRRVCWCFGAADEADADVGALTGLVDPATSDTGICDACWCFMGASALRVTAVDEVHVESTLAEEELRDE